MGALDAPATSVPMMSVDVHTLIVELVNSRATCSASFRSFDAHTAPAEGIVAIYAAW